MTTTAIDSSFSSHSGDFENLNDSELSESLIYCLNGNEPMCITPKNQPTLATSLTAGRTSTIKRSHPKTIELNDHECSESIVYVDCSCINPKKNHLELDETAL